MFVWFVWELSRSGNILDVSIIMGDVIKFTVVHKLKIRSNGESTSESSESHSASKR